MENTDDLVMGKFSDTVFASVAIKSTPAKLYNHLVDIENLSQFFPEMEFKLDELVAVGSVYYSRKKGTQNWSTYQVLALEPNVLMSAELIGKDPIFSALRYEHRFIVEGDKTISLERIDYKFRFGFIGYVINLLFGKKLVKKQVLDAHLKLREKAENDIGISNVE